MSQVNYKNTLRFQEDKGHPYEIQQQNAKPAKSF